MGLSDSCTGISQPKMKIVLFSHLHVIQNLNYAVFFFSVQNISLEESVCNDDVMSKTTTNATNASLQKL